MVNWDIKTVFGMVGHSNLGLADALRKQEAKGALSYFGIRHEGSAGGSQRMNRQKGSRTRLVVHYF